MDVIVIFQIYKNIEGFTLYKINYPFHIFAPKKI